MSEAHDLKLIEEPKGTFTSAIPVVIMMAGITDNKKAELLMLEEFIAAQSTDADCRTAFASVGKSIVRCIVDSDEVSIKVSLLDFPAQEVIPASSHPDCFHHFH